MREKRIALENGVDLSLMRGQVVNAFALKNHVSRIRGDEAAYNAEGGGFAAARRTEQCDEFLVVNVEADGAEHLFAVKFL